MHMEFIIFLWGGNTLMLKKWNSLSLIVRICIGLVIGAILGLAVPGWSWIAVLGKLFVGALKAIAPLLVFVLVSSSLANAKGGNMKKFRAVIFGTALKAAGACTKKTLEDLAGAVSTVVRWVISCAPFGILGLVFDAVSSSGLEIFTTYGELVTVLVVSMLLVALVLNPLIVGITLRHNPYPLIFKCIRQSGVTAFFTRSSAANIPVNMELCKELGLDENMYSVSIPLGSTINMDGAAAVITTFAMTAAFTAGAEITLPMAILLSVVATFSACGTSGVAGGSLLLVPLGCSLFGISNDVAMQVVGVGFIVSVIQDSLETALNSSSDVIFTATAEFLEWKKEGKELPI